MSYASHQHIQGKSQNVSLDQEQVHQQTLDYLQKQLKQVSAANGSQQQKFRMVNHQKQTPLVFKISIGNHGYLISYKQNECLSAVVKIIVLSVLCGLMTIPLFSYTQITSKFRNIIIGLLISIPLLYIFLFFMDPGTVFQDEQQSFSQERIFCLTCQIYRNLSTKHCSFCNKCCKRYDHHCSVFGKCIGKRNIVFFYLFIVATALTFILYFVASIGELYGEFNQKPNQV